MMYTLNQRRVLVGVPRRPYKPDPGAVLGLMGMGASQFRNWLALAWLVGLVLYRFEHTTAGLEAAIIMTIFGAVAPAPDED